MLKPCMKILTGALLALCLVGSPAIPPVSDIGLSPLKPEPLPLAEAAAATNEANAPAPLAGQILGRDDTMSLLDEFPGEVKPAVSADTTSFDEESGRYILSGNVRIMWKQHLITTDEAKLSARTGEIWTQGRTSLRDGEPVFYGDALYASLTGHQAWFFGQRCRMSRPGLTVASDALSYNWETKIAVFDGHVLLIQKDKQRASDHLVYDLTTNQAE